MATFRCKRSGNCVSFTNLNDIEQLRQHEGYTEVPSEKENARPKEQVPHETRQIERQVLRRKHQPH